MNALWKRRGTSGVVTAMALAGLAVGGFAPDAVAQGAPLEATTCAFKGTGRGAPIQLPLVNASGKPATELDLRTKGFEILISVAKGKPLRVVLDTGSLGTVVPESHVGPIDSKDIICPGRITYVSRGIETYYGNWVMAEVGLGMKEKGVATATTNKMPVLVITAADECSRDDKAQGKGSADASVKPVPASPSNPFKVPCDAAPDPKPAANCKRRQNPSIAMMGIGWPGNERFELSLNPMLQVPVATPGYLITGSSVTVGLTEDNTTGFQWLPFRDMPASEPLPQACTTIQSGQNSAVTQCGSLLVDTGIDYMWVGLQGASCPANTAQGLVPAGQSFSLTAPPPGQGPSALSYSFQSLPPPPKILNGNTAAAQSARRGYSKMGPSFVRCAGNASKAFVNTGRNVIFGADFAFTPACNGGSLPENCRGGGCRVGFRQPPAPPAK